MEFESHHVNRVLMELTCIVGQDLGRIYRSKSYIQDMYYIVVQRFCIHLAYMQIKTYRRQENTWDLPASKQFYVHSGNTFWSFGFILHAGKLGL